jgi:predicted metalloprotease with PDZ domain
MSFSMSGISSASGQQTLEPFDFRKPAVSQELWFGEGFTSYYGDLSLCRAGILDQNKYIGSLSALINLAVNSPGWRLWIAGAYE